jgi:hypothetical protein
MSENSHESFLEFDVYERVTQCGRVLGYLSKGHTLTSMNAFRLFDITRLPDRIRDLRLKGYRIRSQMIKLPSGKRCAAYEMGT